jgi:hypothetical protein
MTKLDQLTAASPEVRAEALRRLDGFSRPMTPPRKLLST